jgi:hypothetical protein
MGLSGVEWWCQVAEAGGEGGRVFQGMGEVAQGLDHGMGLTVFEVLPLVGSVFWGLCWPHREQARSHI